MSQKAPSPRDIRLKRLRYQSWHRGCKETDAILGSYCDTFLSDLSDAEIDIFERILDEDDRDIWRWIAYNDTPASPDYTPFIETFRQFHDYASH